MFVCWDWGRANWSNGSVASCVWVGAPVSRQCLSLRDTSADKCVFNSEAAPTRAAWFSCSSPADVQLVCTGVCKSLFDVRVEKRRLNQTVHLMKTSQKYERYIKRNWINYWFHRKVNVNLPINEICLRDVCMIWYFTSSDKSSPLPWRPYQPPCGRIILKQLTYGLYYEAPEEIMTLRQQLFRC